jgi:hypothetical protein
MTGEMTLSRGTNLGEVAEPEFDGGAAARGGLYGTCYFWCESVLVCELHILLNYFKFYLLVNLYRLLYPWHDTEIVLYAGFIRNDGFFD